MDLNQGAVAVVREAAALEVRRPIGVEAREERGKLMVVVAVWMVAAGGECGGGDRKRERAVRRERKQERERSVGRWRKEEGRWRLGLLVAAGAEGESWCGDGRSRWVQGRELVRVEMEEGGPDAPHLWVWCVKDAPARLSGVPSAPTRATRI